MIRHNYVPNRLRAAAILALLALAGSAVAAPAQFRAVVSATADADADRVLVRWQFVEGTSPYTHFDVMRRDGDSDTWVRLNTNPIGALQTVAEIAAQFEAPGRDDALATIQASYGANYAARILDVVTQQTQPDLTLLADQSYVAALVLGQGWLDETTLAGQTYVYEVWGLDALGFTVDRLGRASAVGRAPEALLSPALACTSIGGPTGDMAAFLRWQEPAQRSITAGYDVLRAGIDPMSGACPPDLRIAPDRVRTNEFPVHSDAPGETTAGHALFSSVCSQCHAAPDARVVPPGPSCAACVPGSMSMDCVACGVSGGTVAGFRRLMYSAQVQGAAYHDRPDLFGLSAADVERVFDWVEEFQYSDDGTDTPGGPLAAGQPYCYQVVARDPLGQWSAPTAPQPCFIQDQVPPPVPSPVTVVPVIVATDVESCEVTWERNTDADTLEYRVYRSPAVPRASASATVWAPASPSVVVAQPPSGTDVTWIDPGIGAGQAGQTYFYAVRAADAAANESAFSAWAPCVPRDRIPPPPPSLTIACCPSDSCPPEDDLCFTACVDAGADPAWAEAGWVEGLRTDPRRCPPQLSCGVSGDGATCRWRRAFGDGDYAPGPPFDPTSPIPLDFAPLSDSKLDYELIAIDPSGNESAPAGPFPVISQGSSLLPAPRIAAISFLDETAGSVKVKIGFRALSPDQFVGIALYRQKVPAGQTAPALTPADLVVRHADPNLGSTPQSDLSWVVKPGAQKLGALLPVVPPSGEYLAYDAVTHLYEMVVTLGTAQDNLLHLVAVGWSGKPSLVVPYAWNGWAVGDQKLDWPHWPSENPAGFYPNPDALLLGVGAGYVSVLFQNGSSVCDPESSFVVHRRREGAQRWEQISAPFTCDPAAGGWLEFFDYDVENCFSYSYSVLRRAPDGEIDFRYQVGSVAYTCNP